MSLEWVRAQHNLALIGPPGTGKSHTLIGLGHAAIHAGHKVRYLTAADLIDTLYRGLADNTVGKIIDNLLRADLVILDEIGFAPLDDTGTQLLFRLVAAAYERRSLAVASHGQHHLDTSDVAIEMPTGEGKTLVALLIADYALDQGFVGGLLDGNSSPSGAGPGRGRQA